MSAGSKLSNLLLALPKGGAEVAIVGASVAGSLIATLLSMVLLEPPGLSWRIPFLIATVVPLAVSAPVAIVLMRLLRALEAARHEAQAQASTDALTGLLNRRRWLEVAEREWARARADRAPLAVLLLDVDDFKRVNDVHGHDAGDHVLRTVAAACARSLRPGDALARWGGEEFVALLPGAPLPAALNAAERLRSAVETSTRVGGVEPPVMSVTVSVGVATADSDAANDGGGPTSLERLLQRADSAMYRAKTGGKNRCDAA